MWEKMRYVVVKANKDGTCRYYWQRKGFPSKPLPAKKAERVRIAERLNADADREIKEGRPGPLFGTIAWAVDSYRQGDYSKKSASTRRVYEPWMLAIASECGADSCERLTRGYIRRILDGIDAKSRQGHCAAVLKAVCEIAWEYEFIDSNPCHRLNIAGSGKRDTLWEIEEIQTFLGVCSSGPIYLGVVLLTFTAQRPNDVLKMRWSQYDGNTIQLRQQKTGKLVWVPCHRDLRAVLDKSKTEANGLTMVSGGSGRPMTYAAWSKRFREVRNKAGLEHLQARDLRRTAMVRMAEAGANLVDIAAVSGHDIETTKQILEHYIPRTAKMAKAAIHRWEEAKK